MSPIISRAGFSFGFGRRRGGAAPSGFSATGGNIDALAPGNGYKYHTFTGPGTFTVSSGGNVEVLIVGAGGGTLSHPACCVGHGGGGAGGLLYGSIPISAGPYSVTIGQGSPGAAGGDTIFNSLTAFGGGSGGYYNGGAVPATSGGSGGGAGFQSGNPTGSPATQTPSGALTGYGNRGGNASTGGGQLTNGGGGGAGGAGNDSPGGASGPEGAGGVGLQYPQFTGPLIGVPSLAPLSGYFAGGGGSGVRNNGSGTGGNGGSGGGGNGAPNGNSGTNGTVNSGGGAGGPSGGAGVPSSTGGPGIVIIRYLA